MDYNPIHFSKLIILFFITVFFFTEGTYHFLKNPRYQNTFAKVFIFLMIVLLSADGVYRSVQHSDKLWDGDGGGFELVTLNAAHTYVDKGFTSNCGLSDISKSHYYIDYTETKHGKLSIVSSSKTPVPRIYTHEPPGSAWITGLFVKVCGKGTLICPRILSTITSCLSLLFFFIMIYYSLGPLKSTVLIFCIAIIPMTRNMNYTFHNHNYSVSLFLILIGFLLYFFKKKRKFKISTAIILFILGFVQGWFSYEYIFLTILSPITFALLYSQLDKTEDRIILFLAILFPLIGFLFAAGLHFIQNSLYFGSIMEAFNDIFERLKTRSMSNKAPGWPRDLDRISLSLEYFFVYPRSWTFFIINFPILFSVCLVLIWFKDISITIKKPINISLKWVSSKRNYFVILTAVLASYLWIFVMFNSVADESYHMARILFFSYFVCFLTILECINSAVPTN